MFLEKTISDIFVLVFLAFGEMPAWQAGRTKGQYWKYLVWGSLSATTQQAGIAAKAALPGFLHGEFCSAQYVWRGE